MKSSELGAGLFFGKVCLVGVPWCSGNTCLMIHLFELWIYVFHAICRIWGSDMLKAIMIYSLQSSAFPGVPMTFHSRWRTRCLIHLLYMGSHGHFGIWSVRLIQTPYNKQASDWTIQNDLGIMSWFVDSLAFWVEELLYLWYSIGLSVLEAVQMSREYSFIKEHQKLLGVSEWF